MQKTVSKQPEQVSGKWTIRNSINQFAFKLFKVFASRHQEDSKNICFSPLEVFNSLVMLLIGAKGATEAQLEDMLCLRNFNCQEKYDELVDLREWIVKSNHDIMVYGSCIYIDHRVQIEADYLEKLKTIFETKPKRIDFSRVDQSIYIINKDAYEMTDGVIEGVIASKDIQEEKDVKLIISNSVFFRGYWLFKFSEIRKEDFFYARGEKTAKIDMMSHVGQHRYFYDIELQSQTVSIAYASSDIRMVIILPEKIEQEAINLIGLLDADKLTNLFRKLQHSPKSLTELIIPRFALDAHKVSLQKSVKMMGAKSIYDRDLAQLTGICEKDRLHLTKLVHKAFILVDDRGSRQVASTQETRYLKPIYDAHEGDENESIPVVFKANHPFVFIILDKITGVVCFMGIFANPADILEVVSENDLTKEQITEILTENDNTDVMPTSPYSSSSISG